MDYNSFAVVVVDNETGDVHTHAEWEVDGNIQTAALKAIGNIILRIGTGNVTTSVSYANA